METNGTVVSYVHLWVACITAVDNRIRIIVCLVNVCSRMLEFEVVP